MTKHSNAIIEKLKLFHSNLGKPITQLRGYVRLFERYLHFSKYWLKRFDFIKPKNDKNLNHVQNELKKTGLSKNRKLYF